MSGDFCPALRPRQALLLGLEGLLFANELAVALLFASAAALSPGHWNLDLGWTVAPLACLLLLNTWIYTWVAKTRGFISAFARWPLSAPAPGLTQDEAHAVLAARGAFDQGRFATARGLMERLPQGRRQAGHWLGLGRALALDGSMQEALAALEKGGERPRTLRALRPRRFWGLEAAPRFGPDMPGRLGRVPWAAALALVLVLGSGCMASVLLASWGRLTRTTPGFNEGAFHSEVFGRFTVFYHDQDFKDRVEPVAQAALDHDLDFLGMSAETFGSGAVKLYLCDSQEEYRRRAPSHPSWEAACADPPLSSIYIYRFPRGESVFFEVVLAHELGHLCYYRMVGSSPDDWLNEGLADYLGYDFGLGRAGIPREAWLQEHYFLGLRAKALPFDLFFKTDPHQLPASEVNTFYRQGFSVVYLLVEDYGREPFLKFLRECADRGDINAALAGAFPTIPNVQALAAVWTLFYPEGKAATPGP